ncbi:hypothetical protein LCGC14_0424860 [marine sediment metagenome]|uniref:DNA primase/polymerase bifunctional N-terminal domain-containing protein n=1 Tax=marine sediment metagenome TaxID=412755 RepID=A0A0F9SW00_9ZZZZ
MTTKDALIAAAHLAHQYGISVLPPAQDGTKRPDSKSWKQYQKRQSTQDEIDAWYGDGRTGVGWVTGYVSGGLECIDFDDRTVYREFKSLAEKCGLGELVVKIENGYLEYSPNGAHWMYRCGEISGNTKLAQRADGKSLIETRGEGGFIIVAPTYGSVNKGGKYELVSGSIQTIAKIQPSERRELFNLASFFDEKKRTEKVVSVSVRDDRPGDDYNDRATWGEILEPHGWRLLFSQKGAGYWRRPGKTNGSHSATTCHDGTDYLYVFSTSTNFESERAYSKFSAYGILNHAGDFEAAAKDLQLLGYGGKAPQSDLTVDISALLDNLTAKKPTIGTFPEHLLKVTGAVGEFADWINETSPKPQPILALGAALAAMSTICGRKAQTGTGLRSNMYILSVAESGGGKERAREAIRRLYAEVGAIDYAAVDALASSSAIETRLSSSPSSLFLLDEFGILLQSINSRRADNHIASIKSVLLRLYGATSGLYMGKAHADAKNDVGIEQPNLSIYGTTTPRLFLESINDDSIHEGLFSRLLVFNSEDPDPEYREIPYAASMELPPAVISVFVGWLKRPINVDPEAGDIEAATKPSPLIVPDSLPALKIFKDAETKMRAIRKRLRAAGKEAAAYTRVVTNARKLALVRACGESVEAPEITRDCAAWACELSEYITTFLFQAAIDHGASSETETVVKAVRRAVKNRGGMATQSEITRSTQRYPKRQRDEAIFTLVESGQLVTSKSKKGGTKFLLVES